MARKIENKYGMNIASGADFAENLEYLRSQGKEPISLRDYANTIYENPPERIINCPQGFVKEGVVYVPKQVTLLVRDSPLNDTKIVYKHARDLKESYERMLRDTDPNESDLDRRERRNIANEWCKKPLYIENADEYLRMAEEDSNKEPEERRVLDVTKYFHELDALRIPFNKVRDHEIFRWAFRDGVNKHIEQYIPGDSRDRLFVFGSSKFRDRFQHPNVRQIWFSPSENEVLAARNDKFLLYGRILGN